MEDAGGAPLDSSCLMETRRLIGKAGIARLKESCRESAQGS